MLCEPIELYRQAKSSGRRLAGFYNHNVRIDTPSGPVVVRTPIADAATMDLAIWHESDVLVAVNAHMSTAPRLLYRSTRPPFQVHAYVDGTVVHDVFPRGVRLPGRIRRDVVAFLCSLPRVPKSSLPPTPGSWPCDGDTPGFAAELSQITGRVHERYRVSHRSLFDDLGFPEDPLSPVSQGWSELAHRPFCLVHADVHRKNMIENGTATYFIDWELALWGDPLYDLAAHIHKMVYQPEERKDVTARWLAGISAERSVQWNADLDRYLNHEQIKSAIVDSVRYADLVSSTDLPGAAQQVLVDKLAVKVEMAYRRWGLAAAPSRSDVDEILHVRRPAGTQ